MIRDNQAINLLGSGTISWNNESLETKNLEIAWTVTGGLIIKAKLTGINFERPDKIPIGQAVEIFGTIHENELPQMNFRCDKVLLIRSYKHQNTSTQELTFHQISDLTIINKNAILDSHIYLIPNFIFNGEEQIGNYGNNNYRLDGFSFNYENELITIKHIGNYKENKESIKNFEVSSAITSILTISNEIFEKNPQTAYQLCLLISALYGNDVRPQVRISYDQKKEIGGIHFTNHQAKPYHLKRTYIDYLNMQCSGWGNFINNSLANFINNFEKYKLGQVCNQSVEAQKSMSLISQTAIIWICLEHFTTRFLHESGMYKDKPLSETEQAPFETKLNLVNKELKAIPKEYTQRIKKESWRSNIRNPLFHQGSTNHDNSWQIYYDLLTINIMLLCAVCGYKGKIVIPLLNYPNGQKVVEV